MTTSPLTVPAATRSATRTWTGLVPLLRIDAALCAATGLLAVAAPAAVAEALGPDVPAGAVRWVGAALVVWALDAALLSRGSRRVVRGTALAAALANLAWELATVVLVVAGAFSPTGAVLALGVAAAVGGLGVLQLRALRRGR